MTKASQAALLSGLVFPGTGHMLLRYYLRGSVLILTALAALSIIIKSTVQRAQTIVDQMVNGDVPADLATMTEMVVNSGGDVNDSAVNTAMIVLLVCWIAGIIDAYRLGRMINQQKS